MGGGVGATGGLGVEFKDLFKPAVLCAQCQDKALSTISG